MSAAGGPVELRPPSQAILKSCARIQLIESDAIGTFGGGGTTVHRHRGYSAPPDRLKLFGLPA